MSRARVIVAGLGAVGSAAAWRLAAKGVDVVGLDRWHPPHTNGSTHGDTRVTRLTAWEGAQYVPLARRANALLDELRAEAGRELGEAVGGLFVGLPHETIVAGSRASAEAARVSFEMLDAAEIARRAAGFVVPEGMVGLYDPAAGILFPERIVEAELAAAVRLGATLHFDEPIASWRADGAGVLVTTAQRTVRADALILATGAWMREDLSRLDVPLRIERQTMLWFESTHAGKAAEMRPVLITTDGHDKATVIFPPRDGLVKAGGHGRGEEVDPDRADRTIQTGDYAPTIELLGAQLPGQVGKYRRGATCFYSCTADGHFLIDHHPEHRQVILASPCNGFGFKFSAAVGEMLAAMATGATTPVDPEPWRLRR